MKIYLKEISGLIVKANGKKIILQGGGIINDIDKSDFDAICKENSNFKLWVEKGYIATSESGTSKTDEVVAEKAKAQSKRKIDGISDE